MDVTEVLPPERSLVARLQCSEVSVIGGLSTCMLPFYIHLLSFSKPLLKQLMMMHFFIIVVSWGAQAKAKKKKGIHVF